MEVNSLWNTGFGKAATRSAQTLLIFAVTWVVIYSLAHLKLIVIPILLAIIVASALSPLVALMERIKVKRAAGSLITIMTFIAILGLIGSFIVTSVRSEWAAHKESLSDKLDEAIAWLHSGHLPVSVEQVDKIINSSKQYLTSSSFGQGALQFSGTLTSVLAGVFLTVIILFFLLKDGDKIFSFLVGFLKVSFRDKAHEAGTRAVTVLGDYIRGTTIVALVDAVLIGIGLIIMGVPLVIPLCLLVFIGAFIPYVGSITAGVIISLIALATTNLDTAIIVAVIVLAVNQIEGLLSPIILGNVLKMNALGILIVLSVGAILGGIVGAVIAVPVAAVSWVVWTIWHKPTEATSKQSEDERVPEPEPVDKSEPSE